MAIVEPLPPTSEGRRRLGIRSPATRESVGEIVVNSQADVEAAIVKARDAQVEWARVPVAERARIVRGAIDVLVQRRKEVAKTIIDETGKTQLESLIMEVLPSCDYMNFWCGRAVKELSDEKRKLHGYLRPYKKLMMHYRPLGVIGIITPWNGPFSLAVNPTVQAVLAGNAVILKPSEVAPYSGDWAVRLLTEAGVPEGYYEIEIGDPDIKREGSDVTILTIGATLYRALEAADELQEKYGMSAEVIDARSIVPFNYEKVIKSVKKTGRIILSSDACERGSQLKDMAQTISELAFDYLDAPPVVVGARNWITPAQEYEKYFFPQPSWFIDAIHQKIVPLKGHVSTQNFTEIEQLRLNKYGV